MTRLLADVDALLLDVLIPALGLPDGHVSELLTADLVQRLPFVRAHRWGGAPVHNRFLDSAMCDVDVWATGADAATSRTAALEMGEACRVALYLAWERQTIFPHGSIASFENTAAPVELPAPGQPDGITRVHGTYRLGVCPPL